MQKNIIQTIKEKILQRTLYCIYLRFDRSVQVGHRLMDLATSHMISRQKLITCGMTRMIFDRVKLLAKLKGYKTLKFFNRNNQEMILINEDLLKGVGGNMITILENKEHDFSNFGNLPMEGGEESASG